MEFEVYKTSGEKANKKVNLKDDVFGIEPNDHAIYLDVKQHLANRRQGTSKAKERAEIKGSTRKIKKQKGTGTARAGSIKSPVFRGGGRVFGPRPRNYHFKLNKKVKVLARKSALSHKAKGDTGIRVLEDFTMEAPKTKEFASILSNLSVAGGKTLLVVAGENTNVYLSSKNLSKTKVVAANEINTFDILNADHVLLSESSVSVIENLLS